MKNKFIKKYYLYFIFLIPTFLVLMEFASFRNYKINHKDYYTDTAGFISKVAPLAQDEMKKTGVYASLTIAQAILESGWGGSKLASQYNNYFGIKAGKSWQGAIANMSTQEEVNGVMITVTAKFRAYSSLADSVSDHSSWLLCTYADRDKFKTATTLNEQLAALSRYATSSSYLNSVLSLIKTYNLTQYDNGITYEGNDSNETTCGSGVDGSYTGEGDVNLGDIVINIGDVSGFLNTSYGGDYTKGYIYEHYSPKEIWSNLDTTADVQKIDIIITNIFKQGEKLYGDGQLHFGSFLSDGTTIGAPISGIVSTTGSPLGCYSRVSANYGSTDSVHSKGHSGVDLAAPAQVPIYSVVDGTVQSAVGGCPPIGGLNSNCGSGYGNHVKIKASDGTIFIYGHMFATPLVKTGETISAGQQIGVVGSSGRSTGNHLHFEVRVGNKTTDPLNYIKIENIPSC